MPVKYLGDGGDGGTVIGRTSSDKLGFLGKTTPITRQTLSNAAVTTTAAISTTTTQWAFSTSTQANAIVALVNELRALVVAFGLAE